jgi:DNA-binding YbaB/EbfC family protein
MFDQLKNLKGLASLLGNSGELRAKMEAFQAELAKKTVEADAGAGAVRVRMNCKFEVQRVEIDPVMVATLAGSGTDADREMIEDLIAAAVNAAFSKAQELARDEAMKMTGGLNLPGLTG